MAKKTHTTFARGTRCFVKLKSGESFVDTFVERTDRRIFFKHHTVEHRDLQACGKYREQQ